MTPGFIEMNERFQDEKQAEERARRERERRLVELRAGAPIAKPDAEQAGIADLPLFGTKSLL